MIDEKIIHSLGVINQNLCVKSTQPDIMQISVNSTWLLKITPEKMIIFNKEEFPQYGVDEFATEFINILNEHIIGG